MRRWLVVALLAGGCAVDEESIRVDVQLLAALPEPNPRAVERLLAHGRRALPPIEAALHTADASGRKRLVLLLGRLGDPEAAPLLRHFALYDGAPEVRREAERLLVAWSTLGDALGAAAVRAVDELRERRRREAID